MDLVIRRIYRNIEYNVRLHTVYKQFNMAAVQVYYERNNIITTTPGVMFAQ